MGKTRDKIAKADDIKKKVIHIDAWDVDIEVRTMSLDDRTEFMLRAADDAGGLDKKLFTPMLIISCCYEPNTSERMFDFGDDVKMLQGKQGVAVSELSNIAMDMNGFGKTSETKIGKN